MNTILLPRGVRNHNPGNIRLSKTRWQGQKPVQTDPDFIEFDDPIMGLRALMRVLMTYFTKYQLNTVESIINRWAPPHENATDSYIFHVCRKLKVKRRDALDLYNPETLITLSKAIVRHENGRPQNAYPSHWYDDSVYHSAHQKLLNTIVSA